MQFQIACKHCHRLFAIESEAGRTVRCNCPYCGEGMMVVTPGTVPEDGAAGSLQLAQAVRRRYRAIARNRLQAGGNVDG